MRPDHALGLVKERAGGRHQSLGSNDHVVAGHRGLGRGRREKRRRKGEGKRRGEKRGREE